MISIYLFGKPAWEMDIEGEEIDPEELREKGKELESRLDRVADQIEKLKNNGWECEGGLYDSMCWKKQMDLKGHFPETKEETREELEELDIDPETLTIIPYEEM